MSLKDKLKSKKIRVFIIGGLIVVALGGIFISKKMTAINILADESMEEFIESYSIPENEKVFINGSITPKESKSFSIESGYEISKVNVSNGQYVNKGYSLYTTKNNEILSQIQELESQLKELQNQKSKASEDLASINSEISKTNSEIKKLKDKSYVTTYAPFSGKIYIHEESSQDEVTSYMTLESNDHYMKGQVSEQDLPKISKDMPVNIYVFATEKELTGKISSISTRPSTSQSSSDYTPSSSLSYYDVYVEFDTQNDLVNGYHIQASIEIENKNPKIPTTAILEDGDSSYVYKVIDGKIVKQNIKINSKSDDYAVLNSGLGQNDVIIKYPTEDMKEGDEVMVDSINESSSHGEEGI